MRQASHHYIARILLCFGLQLALTSSWAAIDLVVSRGPGTDEITLQWSGDQPPYEVFRSFDPATVTDAVNKLGETDDDTWIDSPPAASILFYRVRSLCPTPCAPGHLCCHGSCVDVSGDPNNCGGCDVVCPPPSPGCDPTQLCFNSTCIDEGIILISELLIAPDNTFDEFGEWIEVFNPTSRDVDLRDWILRDDEFDLHIISTSVVVPPSGFVVLMRNNDPAVNCDVMGDYQYSNFVLGNSGDEVVLEAAGCLIDRLIYPVNFDVKGSANNLDPSAFDHILNDDLANWCLASTRMQCGDTGTPGESNIPCP